MSERPSDPILRWLRETLKKKGMNTAALAKAVGAPRAEVRGVLAGRSPLTVDQLVSWTQALSLSMEDFLQIPGVDAGSVDAGEPDPPAEPEPSAGPRLVALSAAREPAPPPPSDGGVRIDPFGDPAVQAIRTAFALGVDFAFVADSSQLGASGIPAGVLRRFPQQILIQLDAAFHNYNDPRYGDETLTLDLSFDVVYTCTFPWRSIQRVVYQMESIETAPPDDEPEKKGPGLRLVKG